MTQPDEPPRIQARRHLLEGRREPGEALPKVKVEAGTKCAAGTVAAVR